MDPTPDRRHDVNANLRKIKQEKDANLAQWNDSGDMFSQIPNQDYYLKLDKSLANLPRSLYIDELLSLCCNDVKTINWYRSYLADQARKSPECPASRLVKRKNTVNRSNSQQCATDCYILRMFIDGERSAEINTVFSQAGPTIETPSDDLNYSMYDTQKRRLHRHKATFSTHRLGNGSRKSDRNSRNHDVNLHGHWRDKRTSTK